MLNRNTLILILVYFLVIVTSGCESEMKHPADTTGMMASTLINLNHSPSSSEKAALQKVVDGAEASAEEKIVAQALINLNHQASDADKSKLKKIMNNPAAPEKIKSMANIIHGINHKVSGADKEKLQAMLK